MKKLLPVALLAIAACTQEPVRVVLKGQDFFGRDAGQYASANQTNQLAFRDESRPSTVSFRAEPTAVAHRAESVGVSELPPLARNQQASMFQDRTAPVGRVMPGGAPLQRDLAEIHVTPAVQTQEMPQPRMISSGMQVESPASANGASPNWYQGQVVLAKAERTLPLEDAAAMPQFIWPVRGKIISHFGRKANGLKNDGVNIAANYGDPVLAAGDGTVVYAGNDLKGYGNMAIIRHDNGWMSAYAHCDRLYTKENSRVRQGERIATVGATGSVESAQLHFGLRNGKTPMDPTQYLSSDFAAR